MTFSTKRLFRTKSISNQSVSSHTVSSQVREFSDTVLVQVLQEKNVARDSNADNLTTKFTNTSTALTSILNGLKLRDNNLNDDIPWSRYKKTTTTYDIIIRINSLFDLRSHGWEILLGEHIQTTIPIDMALENKNDECTENVTSKKTASKIKEGAIVTVLGAYNRGKSFLLNQLCNVELPNGNLVHTEGISITAGKENYTNIVFLDTAGTDTPVKHDDIDCKRATEALLREVLLHLCTFIIIVVNRLRATDQIYIREILKYCETTKKKVGIIIVHNLFDIETVHDVEQTIYNEVELIFHAAPRQIEPVLNGETKRIKFFCSKQGDIDVRHFILAKSGSEAAHIWNRQSLDGIMNMFQNSSEHHANLDIIDRMISFVNTKLPHLFVRSDNFTVDDTQKSLQIVQHNTQPYIVLSDRKNRQDLIDEPCQLELSEKLVYDNAGYFLRHEIEEWQPRYNLYEDNDKIRLVLELPGFKKGECETTLTEKAIIIKGTRANFNASAPDTTIHQSDIPSGSFKLHIPFRCEINTHEATSIRDDGFILITVPKKKINEERIEI